MKEYQLNKINHSNYPLVELIHFIILFLKTNFISFLVLMLINTNTSDRNLWIRFFLAFYSIKRDLARTLSKFLIFCIFEVNSSNSFFLCYKADGAVLVNICSSEVNFGNSFCCNVFGRVNC